MIFAVEMIKRKWLKFDSGMTEQLIMSLTIQLS